MNVRRLWQHASKRSTFLTKDTFMKILRLLIPFFSLAVAVAQPSFQPAPALTLPLRAGWALQSSAKVTATGEAISSPSVDAGIWLQAEVRPTVVGEEVESKLRGDAF